MQRRQTSVQGHPESLRAVAQQDPGTSQDTVSVERGQPKMRQTRGQPPAQPKQEVSSAPSVHSRRRKPYKRQKPPEEALGEPHVEATSPQPEQAPAATLSQPPKKRPRPDVSPASQAGAQTAAQPFTPELGRDLAAGAAQTPSQPVRTAEEWRADRAQMPQEGSPEVQQPGRPEMLGRQESATPDLATSQAGGQTSQIGTPLASGQSDRVDAPASLSLQSAELQAAMQTCGILGSLESVLATRQAAVPAFASALSAPPTTAPAELASRSSTALPLSTQQALLGALLRSLGKHRESGLATAQSAVVPKSDSLPAYPYRPKAIRTGLSTESSAFKAVERAAAATSAPAQDTLSFLAQYASQSKGGIGTAQPQASAAEQPVSQVLAQHAVSVSAGELAFRERDPELWRILSGGRTAQQGQPAPGTPGSAGQPIERGFRSLSNPVASGLMSRGTVLLPNPFAQLSSLPLRAKLPDLASLQKKPGRRRGTLPDLAEGGGDSDTVSVLSQHHSSLKLDHEVTGPQELHRPAREALDSEAARKRKALGGALDFSSSSKPGLPLQLQSFSQEYAPQGILPHQQIARVAQSAMLGGQASRPLGTLGSAGVPSLQIRPSEASAASIQVLETILSQAHREGGHNISKNLQNYIAQAQAPAALSSAPPEVAPVPPAKLQLRHMHSQASPPVSPSAGRADKFTTIAGAVSPPLGGPTSPSVDTGDRGNPAGTPLDKHERRKANNRESARRTRAKKSNRIAELDEENCQLRAQLALLQAQVAELQTRLASLPQISPHQRSLMDENESLKLEVQALRSLITGAALAAGGMGAGQQPGTSQVAPASQGA